MQTDNPDITANSPQPCWSFQEAGYEATAYANATLAYEALIPQNSSVHYHLLGLTNTPKVNLGANPSSGSWIVTVTYGYTKATTNPEVISYEDVPVGSYSATFPWSCSS